MRQNTFLVDIYFCCIEKIVRFIKTALRFAFAGACSKNVSTQPHAVIIAYTCWPLWGSEPEVGWRWAIEAGKSAKVHVITRKEAENFIREYIKKNGEVPNVNFIIKDFPLLSRWIKGVRFNRIHYIFWQFLAIKEILKMNKKDAVDIVHHVTFVNIWIPAFAMLLPFHTVWGPTGANLGIPKQFKKRMGLSFSERLIDWFRKFLIQRLSAINPVLHMAYIGAERIIVINADCKELIPYRYQCKVQISSANGVSSYEFITRSPKPDEVRILYVGRLLNFKGIHFAVRAFDKFLRGINYIAKFIIITGQNYDTDNPKFHRFLRSGEEQEQKRTPPGKHEERELLRLIGYIEQRGIEPYVEIYGGMSGERVMEEIKQAHILLFPSFEGGGMVVLESLSVGIPLVCFDTGGAGEYVDSTCGIKIEIGEYDECVEKLSHALMKLSTDLELWKTLSRGGLKRIKDFYLWSHKGELIAKCYNELMNQNSAVN